MNGAPITRMYKIIEVSLDKINWNISIMTDGYVVIDFNLEKGFYKFKRIRRINKKLFQAYKILYQRKIKYDTKKAN